MHTIPNRPEFLTSVWRTWCTPLVMGLCGSIAGLASSEAQDVDKTKVGATRLAPEGAPRAPVDEAAARTKRSQFEVRHAKPAELATTLKHYFQPDADFRLADPESN